MHMYIWMRIDGVIINAELLAFSFGHTNEACAEDLPRATVAQEYGVLKVALSSTHPHLPTLMLAATHGTRIREVFISCIRKDRKGRVQKYLKYRLDGVTIYRYTALAKKTVISLITESMQMSYG